MLHDIKIGDQIRGGRYGTHPHYGLIAEVIKVYQYNIDARIVFIDNDKYRGRFHIGDILDFTHKNYWDKYCP